MSTLDATAHIESLYSDHHHWLTAWLRRRLGNRFDAEDLAHDTFVRVLGTGCAPSREDSRAHLTQIAKGLAIDLQRRRVIEAAYLDAIARLPTATAPSPEERALAIEALVCLDGALAGLPSHVREVFLMSRLEGMTYPEIAAVRRLSVGAVRKYMLRAAQHCHKVLGRLGS